MLLGGLRFAKLKSGSWLYVFGYSRLLGRAVHQIFTPSRGYDGGVVVRGFHYSGDYYAGAALSRFSRQVKRLELGRALALVCLGVALGPAGKGGCGQRGSMVLWGAVLYCTELRRASTDPARKTLNLLRRQDAM